MSDLKLTHKEWSDKLLERLPKKKTEPDLSNKHDQTPIANYGWNKYRREVIKAIKETG